MVKEQIYVEGIDVRKSKQSGDEFYVVKSNKGDLSCFEKNIMEKLDPCMRKTIEVEIVEAGKYKNIRDFYGIVENAAAPEAKPAEKEEGKAGAKIEMLVSYAKDLVIAGKEETMEKAITSVFGAYREISKQL